LLPLEMGLKDYRGDTQVGFIDRAPRALEVVRPGDLD